MKIYEMSFIDSEVKSILEAFDLANELLKKNVSIGNVVWRVFEKYSPTIFTSANINKVRDCVNTLLFDDIEERNNVLDFCNYAEIAVGGFDFGANHE